MDDLTPQIRKGLDRLAGGFDVAHAGYVARGQGPDGGWPGRQGASDLYYTAFALRAADLLGCDARTLWTRAAEFLSGLSPDGIVDITSALASERLLSAHGLGGALTWVPDDEWASRIETLRVEGGYARRHEAAPSTYLTFLAALCYEHLDVDLPRPGELVDCIGGRQRVDGGFAETAEENASGANPTAAAVALLTRLNALDGPDRCRAADFLRGAQREDGGFGAHALAPCSDLLSTFTAMACLLSLEEERSIRLAAAARFVRDLAVAGGGFRGTLHDEGPDVEYTFYGVGTVGLVSSVATCRHACQGACAGCPAGQETPHEPTR